LMRRRAKRVPEGQARKKEGSKACILCCLRKTRFKTGLVKSKKATGQGHV